MQSAALRNKLVYKLIADRLGALSNGHVKLGSLPSEITRALDDLFATKAYGFREVVLTSVAAWGVGIDFDPVTGNFYDCNPRAVFEAGIRPALAEAGIPHMKSGPLNVAKNQRKLNVEWARGRRPESAALAAAKTLEWIVADRRRAPVILDYILRRLQQEAVRLDSLAVELRSDGLLGPTFLLLTSLITRTPDAGNTPQVIVSLLLASLLEDSTSTVDDYGKACEANMTAKKPGDITVWNENGSPAHIYEVTVKAIDLNRIDDSAASVHAHAEGIQEVTWLCRLPTDVEPLKLGSKRFLERNGIRNEFVDLFGWMHSVLEIIGADRRVALLGQLTEYIAKPTTSELVKQEWRKLNLPAEP